MPSSALARSTVYDLIYNPAVTRMMRDAAMAGADTIGGLDMLVGQAQEQFEWWIGVQKLAGRSDARRGDQAAFGVQRR